MISHIKRLDSAYQMGFGRERPLAGLPISITQNHSDAEDLISGIEVMDLSVLHNLNLEFQERRENSIRGDPP